MEKRKNKEEVAGLLYDLAKDGFMAADISVSFRLDDKEEVERFRAMVNDSGMPIDLCDIGLEIGMPTIGLIAAEPKEELKSMNDVRTFFENCKALSGTARLKSYLFMVMKEKGCIYVVSDSKTFLERLKNERVARVNMITEYVLPFDEFVSIEY